ncbi:DUF2637 domain-containing protein [Amycolatopsis sp. NPDC021455]|uniref:DUF2637 domain-containing protein n=1 Tax=Amycolatopsis sp. NPDC021455 TaxID=3154901 RepID=UPI0033E14F4C
MSIDKLTAALRVLITVALGGIGGAAGFTHTHDWAIHHGQHGWLAWADAVVIECLAIVAGFEVARDHHRGTTRRITFPLVVLVAALGVQMAAQVALAEPSPAGWLVAAMPALGFLVVVKLLMRRTLEPATTPAPAPATVPEPAPAALEPAAQARTSPVRGKVLGKLPAGIRDTVTATTADVHATGRQVTADDLSARVALPEAMLTALVDELNATVNHHPVTA